MSLSFLSVCSGIDAPAAAWLPLGWQRVAVAEIEPFCCALLKHYDPEVKNLGDILQIDGREWRGLVDVLVGGTPCQSFSVAGLRGSLSDARGNLALKFVEFVHAIRPSFTLWENVPGVLSTDDNAFGCFLGGLVGADAPLVSAAGWSRAGVVDGPLGSAAWRILDAQYFGLAQRRERVFVVFCFRDGPHPAEILFEWESLRRDSAPSREAGQSTAGTLSARTSGGDGLGTDFDLGGGLDR